MKKVIVALTAASMVLSACAGREANPVQIIQEGDSSLSCNQLRQEISISQASLSRLLGDQKKVQNNNTAAVAAGALIFFPALFFLNLKGAAKEEAKALQDRIVGLAERHNNRGCKPPIKVQFGKEAAAEAKAAEDAAKAEAE